MLVEKPFSKPFFLYLMTLLVLHLVDELDICGPVHSCWMYPIEQATKNLKGYICNLCKPEGSVVKGYIFDEALGLYTKYMQNFQTMRRHIWNVNEEEGWVGEDLEGVPKPKTLIIELQNIARLYVCKNHETLFPWLK